MAELRTNQEWLRDLNASGSAQEAAIADLRKLLLRAALYFFSRNLGDFAGLSQRGNSAAGRRLRSGCTDCRHGSSGGFPKRQ